MVDGLGRSAAPLADTNGTVKEVHSAQHSHGKVRRGQER